MSLCAKVAGYTLLLFCYSTAPAQSQSSPPVDYYAGFIGKWVGTDLYFERGSWVTIPVEINIFSYRKNDRIRLEYTYGTKGKRDFDRETKFLTLNPAKEQMLLQWQGFDKEEYLTTGLRAFTQVGHGSFIAAMRMTDSGKDVSYLCSFDLEPSAFTYHWDRTSDGTHFERVSTFSLKRVPPPDLPALSLP